MVLFLGGWRGGGGVVPMIRTIGFLGLYWDPPIWENFLGEGRKLLVEPCSHYSVKGTYRWVCGGRRSQSSSEVTEPTH